jgi:molybdopterin molybdotransferase
MIEYHEALERVLAEARPCGDTELPVADAAGFVAARHVVALIDSPPFDKAAMDGYAVRADDLTQLPTCLDLVGSSAAGSPAACRVGPGQAAAIATGAPVPEGADTVVMVEHTDREGDDRVRVLRDSGTNVCSRGEDVRAGELVLRAGELLTPLRVAVAAAAGHALLWVRRRPSVAVLCTGTEVVEPGEPTGPSCIYNANGSMLVSLSSGVCDTVAYLGVTGDQEGALEDAVRRGLESDLFLVTGGVSVGRYDLVPAVLDAVGVRTVFHKVAIKPGKPTLFGVADGRFIFGVPGNPLSCFVVFKLLIEPAIGALSGRTDRLPPFETGVNAEPFARNPDRLGVLPCTVTRRNDAPLLRRCRINGSADIVGASAADGLMLVPAGAETVQEGRQLEFLAL